MVFDLDQTLFDRQLAFDRWTDSLNVSHRDRTRLRTLDQNGSGDRLELFAEYGSMKGETIDQRGFVRALVQFIELHRGLVASLQRLRERFHLAVLTNGGTETQHAKLRFLALDQVFSADRIFVSQQIGFSKPDRRAFDRVAAALDTPAHQCLYFGDRVDTDITAARKAGWMACHVRCPADLIVQVNSLGPNFDGVDPIKDSNAEGSLSRSTEGVAHPC
ncbi:putative HAD-hydrolase YfnB [Allorhodopirellula heiligendammensis]|uniref:HAD-hydrolase YfnB n=2 Tax=Allorhodopirellula heiligendammensis TaxID=2714739 RepID=A0A5C6C3I7_9BACT|nr:putative HAD-hydrolase YfnB [Allorhodopirellula heiligendammensis]